MKRRPIPVRVDEAELAHWDACAAEAGMTRSEYARRVLGGTVLGDHRPGVVEQVAGARVPVGSAADGRTPVAPVTRVADVRCPKDGGMTYGLGAGKRRCRVCGWTGPV